MGISVRDALPRIGEMFFAGGPNMEQEHGGIRDQPHSWFKRLVAMHDGSRSRPALNGPGAGAASSRCDRSLAAEDAGRPFSICRPGHRRPDGDLEPAYSIVDDNRGLGYKLWA